MPTASFAAASPARAACALWRRCARWPAAAWSLPLPLALLLGGWSGVTHAQAAVPEYQLKAAVIFNFAVFAEWPAAALPPAGPLTLCAYQGNALLAALQALADKNINGHRLEARALAAGGAARNCHLLVLDRQDRERWPQLHRELGTASVLTIADDRQIAADGAMLALSMEDKRIVFDANLAALRGAGLTLSSKLLRLARSAQ
ncbi:YfiR family protein [Duganella sp. CT11-25]|uniref:YfiR family protein n=1 Tax=unclassified Duganella TaxID=2636909 RepID=UPI0039AFE54D